MKQELVDLHCHMLPGIDDGAKDIDISMQMLRQSVQSGVAGIVFTPHFNYERMTVEQFYANRKRAFAQVKDCLRAEGLPLAAKLGAEIYFTTALPTLDLKKLCFAKSRYLLMEFPTTYHPPGISEVLFELLGLGYTPILAHVERYPFVEEEPTLLYEWVTMGALAQINAAGLIRGGSVAKRMQQYMDWGLIHLICTDAHNLGHRAPNLAEGYATLSPKRQKYFRQNAVDVYLGKELYPPDPQKPVYRLGHWR